jgi:hypothetical protein
LRISGEVRVTYEHIKALLLPEPKKIAVSAGVHSDGTGLGHDGPQ